MTKWYPGEVETPDTDPYDSYGNGWREGADAILDALRKRGYHVDHDCSFSSVGESRTLGNTNVKGTYVFIPDDGEFDENTYPEH